MYLPVWSHTNKMFQSPRGGKVEVPKETTKAPETTFQSPRGGKVGGMDAQVGIRSSFNPPEGVR